MTEILAKHTFAASDPVATLAKRLEAQWPSIDQARRDAEATRRQIIDALTKRSSLFETPEISLVVFGSIARGEQTLRSDVDWTLLVDGQANAQHRDIVHEIDKAIVDLGLGAPGAGGPFASMSFSHELVQLIGGPHDTNRNTTRRVLLLLESCSLGSSVVHERVVRAILSRYLEEDVSFRSPKGQEQTVPRFLLNDIVRYWRTVAVDYAHMRAEHGGKKSAMRNIKLRMSRKLIFAAGLLMCFGCYLDKNGEEQLHFDFTTQSWLPYLTNRLMKRVQETPLMTLADAMIKYADNDNAARSVFDAYDAFLTALGDPDVRKELEELPMETAHSNKTFSGLRDHSKQFQEGLEALFFDSPKLRPLTRQYGVF